VLDEIQRNVDEFGIANFRFTDSCFSAPPERAATICDAIYDRFIRSGIPIKWSSYSRINNLTHNLLEKMKRSGCIALDIGAESGAPSILKKMGRNYTREQIINVAKAARELDIITDFNIVVGFPGETDETVEETIDMLQEAKPDAFSCFVLFVAPHMDISGRGVRYGLNGSGLSWSHATMTSEKAHQALERISQSVTNSCSFPGAESFAGYLAAIGYSLEQIRVFFKATSQLARSGKDEMSRTIVEEACTRLRGWW
jgi:p-methyltransferase